MSAPHSQHQQDGHHHPHDGQEFTQQLNEENQRLGHGHHTKAELDAELEEARQRREEHLAEVAKAAHDSALHPSERE